MSSGREKFLQTYREFMTPRLPAIAKEWDALPVGFRKLLAVQSRQPSLVDKRLPEMTADQMRRLSVAASDLERLCWLAQRSLNRYSMTKG